MPNGFVGKRLPAIWLMEDELSSSFASARTGFLTKIAMFVPYSFKDMIAVDLVEFSAMESLKMLNYVTEVQRLCVPEDIFWYAFWNTDAEGDRLLIKGTSGATCVVGWHEVAVAFGANHEDVEEFRAIKSNNKNFSEYMPSEYVLETVETNVARKLVNGRPYEEISYYKEAAPYGPTYFLMSVIAELFWCNGRSTRYTTPMVYPYLRSLHSHQTNWAKVILHCLKTEIQFLQKRARTPDNTKDGNDDDANTTPPRTVRTRVTSKTPPVIQVAPGDAGTSSIPKPIDGNSNELREFGHKIGLLLGDIVSKQLEGSLGHLLADANAGRLLPKQDADLAKKLKEAESSRTDLNDQVVALKAEVQRCKGQAASEAVLSSSKKELELARKEVASAKATIAQLEVDLRKARQEVTIRANEEAKLKAQLKALAEDLEEAKVNLLAHGCVFPLKATGSLFVFLKHKLHPILFLHVNSANQETKLQQEVSAMQKQLQGQTSTADRYIRAFQSADLDNQVVSLQGQVDSHKFTAERAEKAQVALHLELNQVKTDLRMLQISGSSS
ncbi:hypothetical protein R1sor_001596 [Riccia sorocarpa]|uniref:Uncharacterized protein n=1 Tax=Riccia sorocarpa TaxID=122646 RepID=A0ABD3H0C1_9MARC